MNPTLRPHRLILILLLYILFNIAIADSPAPTAPAQQTEQSTTTTGYLQTFLNKSWQLLLTLSARLGINQQTESTYEPKFSNQKQSSVPKYIVAIHPLHNPQKLFDVYGPIVDYIDANIPEADFVLEASRNYEEFNKKLFSGKFDFAMPNPYQTIVALKHGYRVFGKMADDEDFRGIILVRRDSNIHQIADLKGKAVSYPSLSAVAATMMPQYFLQTHGIDINHDIENRYVGSQESSIMNVLRGHVAAGATWPVPWKTFMQENPEEAQQLEVKWQTESLQNNGWVVREALPEATVSKFASLLFNLDQHEQGKTMLARIPVSRFEAANNDSYGPVKAFIETFSKTVRPLTE